MYQDIIKLNPNFKIIINELNPETYDKNILCDKILINSKKLYENFKSYVE